MAKCEKFSYILTLLVSVLLPHLTAFAAESEKDLGTSQPKNRAKIIQPSDVAKADLKKIKKTAVLISSTLPLFGQVAEDQLAIKLRDAGYDMTARTKLSDMTQKELLKEDVARLQAELNAYKEQLEFEKQLEKEDERTKTIQRLTKQVDQALAQIEKMKAEPQKESTSIPEVAKSLGLDAVLVGTLFEGKRQISFPDQKPPVSIEKIVVATFHLQVIDARTEKVLLSIMLEYDQGENVTNATDAMAKILKDKMS